MRSSILLFLWRTVTCHAWMFSIAFFALAAALPSTGCDAGLTAESAYDDRVACMNAWMESASAMVAGFVVIFYWWTVGRGQCRRWDPPR